MARIPRLAIAFGLTFILLGVSLAPMPAAAEEVPITLYGDTSGGWGHTNASLGTPGPQITVDQGDNITFSLFSADGNDHNWYIDYDGDANDDGTEPDSPDFNTNVTWTFTADQNGTFAYRSRFSQDEASMWGLITIRPPGTGGTPLAGDPTILLVAVGIAVAGAIFIVAVAMRRRRMGPPLPPPPPD